MTSYRLRKIVTFLERIVAPILGRMLWPPISAQTICWTDENKEELIMLDTGNKYHFPGGLVKYGEHPKKAAAREFNEETGLDSELTNLLCVKTGSRSIKGIHFYYEGFLKEYKETEGTWEGKPVKISKHKVSNRLDKLREN